MLRASIVTAGASMFLAGLSFINAVVTARGLGVEGRGLLAASLLIVGVGRVLGLMGLGDAFVRAVSQRRLDGAEIRLLYVALALTAIVGLASGIAGVLLTPLTETGLSILALTVIWTATGSMLDFLIASARLNSDLIVFNLLRISGPLLATLVTTIAFLATDLSVKLVLVIQVVASIASLWWALALVRNMARTVLEERRDGVFLSSGGPQMTLRQFLGLGLTYNWIAVLGLLITHAHTAIVMTFATLGALGVYSAVYGLSRMIVPIQMAIGSAVFARSVRHSNEASAVPALRAYRLTTAPMLVVAFCASATGPWVVPWLLGEDFSSGVLPFGILLVESVIGGAAYILGQHLQGAGMLHSVLWRNVLSLVPVILSPFFLKEEQLLVGMSLVLLCSALIRLLATLFAYRKASPLPELWPVPLGNDLRLIMILFGGKG